VRRQRRDVHDRPVDHSGAEDLAWQNRPIEVQLHDLVERRRRQLEERLLADRCRGDVAARRVDKHVDLLAAVERRLARALELGQIEHIRFENECRSAELLCECVEACAPSGEQAHLGPSRSEATRNRAAENARGAGDHGDSALETEQLRDGLHQD